MAFAQYPRGRVPGKPAQPGGISGPFVLWCGRRDVAMKYASEERRDFWAISPRVTITGYATQVAQAYRVAREDITTAEITETDVTTPMEDWTQMTSRQFGTGSRTEPQLALFAPDSTGSLTDLFSETED